MTITHNDNSFSYTTIDLRKLYYQAGVENKPTVFLFSDTQVLDESFLEDINNILSSGEVPNLYKPEEFEEVCIFFFIVLRSNSSSLSNLKSFLKLEFFREKILLDLFYAFILSSKSNQPTMQALVIIR